jgi:hypothetical protein
MGTKNADDLNLLLAKRTIGKATPVALYVNNAAGALSGALAKGSKFILKANANVYWKRGGATMVGTDVLVTEGAVPSTHTPLFGGESVVIIVEHDDTDNYLAFRTATGTALVWVIACGDLTRQ